MQHVVLGVSKEKRLSWHNTLDNFIVRLRVICKMCSAPVPIAYVLFQT